MLRRVWQREALAEMLQAGLSAMFHQRYREVMCFVGLRFVLALWESYKPRSFGFWQAKEDLIWAALALAPRAETHSSADLS